MTQKSRKKKTIVYILLVLLVFALLLIDSNYRIVTEEYTVQFADLPTGFDGYRILQLSDIHAAEYLQGNDYLAEKVRAADPDIIALTGDLVDQNEQLEIIRPLLLQLTEIAPVYYVTGNHEWDGVDMSALFDLLEECGITTLRNNYVYLTAGSDKIVLAGAEDPNGPADMETPEELVERIDAETDSAFVVMLNHRNDRLALYADLGVPFVLSGHAHGGIVRLPFTDGLVGPKRELLPTYTSGIYTKNDTVMLVSRGIGNHTGFPRFLNNPHIAVAVLQKGV